MKKEKENIKITKFYKTNPRRDIAYCACDNYYSYCNTCISNNNNC